MVVTAPGHRAHRGIQVHRSESLLRRDFRGRHGIRVTSQARTLLDCAPAMHDKALARAVNEARRRTQLRLADLADVDRALSRAIQAHAGWHPSRSSPAVQRARAGRTTSPRSAPISGYPRPVMAAKVAGWEVDALFPRERVIVELDGWEFHSSRQSFEDDRERDACTLAAGHVTLRLTWTRMHERARGEAARLHAHPAPTTGARGVRPGPPASDPVSAASRGGPARRRT